MVQSVPESAGIVDQSVDQLARPQPKRPVPYRPPASEPVRAGAHDRARWRWPDPVLLVPALVTFVIVVWDLGQPSYWRDEAATLDADSRSVPALLRMLTNVDAVHGAYYLLMWPIVHLFGTNEIVLRLPSALAMAATAAGIAALGRRLHSARAGLYAGLAFAAFPQVSRYGQEARSYALVFACATLASYLLVRALDEPGRRWLSGYGVAIAVLGVLNLFGLLILAGHAVFVFARARALMRRWLVVAAVSCLPALPIVVLAWQQRGQLGWLTPPNPTTAPGDLAVWLAGSTGSVALVSVLIGFGMRARNGAATAWLALPWLVAPPLLLISAAAVATPVYTERYVAYCLPALALPVGVGLAGITFAPRVIALVLIAVLGLPTQFAQRQPDGHGDNARAVAAVLTQHAQPGDGVLYHCLNCHYPDMPREFAFAYPAAFAPLEDLALAESPSASGTLRGTTTDQATLDRRIEGARRVWLIETGGKTLPGPLAGRGLRLVAVYPADNVTVALYEH